jgi:hypothetical protein
MEYTSGASIEEANTVGEGLFILLVVLVELVRLFLIGTKLRDTSSYWDIGI